MLMIAQAVREALKVTDPEGPRDRIRLIAQSKLEQSGNMNEKIKPHNVDQGIKKIKDRMNVEVLSKELVVEYENKYKEKLVFEVEGRPILSPAAKPMTMKVPPALDPTYRELKEAVPYAKSVGGIDRAIAILQALKELNNEYSSETKTAHAPGTNSKSTQLNTTS